ncbi:MAG: DUF4492 domain-containing protein [Bacteroidales bacterium]|nr:DUF4492 domain-containing protein [Bacteroidales bacterium]
MQLIRKIWNFYVEGFRSMTIGKTLWLIIIIKLCVFFLILKLLFFPDFLNQRCETPGQKADYVGKELLKPLRQE